MRVFSYNIQFGRGLDRQIDLGRVCDPLIQADIICLQEVDQWWKRSGDVDQVAEIASLLPEFYYVFGASFNLDDSFRSATGALVNRRRCQGNMILSRWPILSTRTFNLPMTVDPVRFNMQMCFVEASIDTGSRYLRLYNLHAGYLEVEERLAQVECFAEVFNRSPTEKGAWSGKPDIDGDDWSNQRVAPRLPATAIVCADFNAQADSREYRRLIDLTGLVDCWSVADPENLLATTLRKETSADIRISGKVDHILVTPDLVDRVERVEIDQRAEGSDHKPIQAIIEPGDSKT